MIDYKQKEVSYIISIASLIGITVISLAAIAIQIFLNELPSPLCLLQRAGVMAIGVGYMMNLFFGCKSRYLAMSTFAAILTIFISIRQVILHVAPKSGGYADIITDNHMYSWVIFVGFAVILWNCLIHLYLNRNYTTIPHNKLLQWLARISILMFIVTIIINIVLTFLECGFGQCPENPISYMYLL